MSGRFPRADVAYRGVHDTFGKKKKRDVLFRQARLLVYANPRMLSNDEFQFVPLLPAGCFATFFESGNFDNGRFSQAFFFSCMYFSGLKCFEEIYGNAVVAFWK